MKNNFLLKNEDKSNQIDNVMSELFRYGVLEQEKEKLYLENKKEINNLIKLCFFVFKFISASS